MKTAILLFDGAKQIMFTPETESEKEALRLITADDHIHTTIVEGTFSTGYSDVFGANIYKCQGGYYRAEKDTDSVMFVLTPKKKSQPKI